MDGRCELIRNERNGSPLSVKYILVAYVKTKQDLYIVIEIRS